MMVHIELSPGPTSLSENQQAIVSFRSYLESRMANEPAPGASKENLTHTNPRNKGISIT